MIFVVSQGKLDPFRRRVDMIFGVSQGRLDTFQRRVDNTYLRPPHHDLMYVFKANKVARRGLAVQGYSGMIRKVPTSQIVKCQAYQRTV